MEAAQQLKEEGRKLQILIAGVGGYEEELRGEVARRGLEDTVFFLGFQTDVAPVLSVLEVSTPPTALRPPACLSWRG